MEKEWNLSNRQNYGYQNEFDFVELFNHKYLSDLDEKSQTFLKELFDNKIDNDEKIIAWKNRMVQKADIFIKYKNIIKNISIKCGRDNSIHHEQVQEFKRYLGTLGIPYKVIDNYMNYLFGYMRDSQGKIDLSTRLSSEEYKKIYQSEIDIFNQYINKTRIIVDMIDRFIIRGRNSDYDVDALVCGKTDNYIWIMKYDLYDLILTNRSMKFTSPHIACLTLGPKKRVLSGESNNVKDRYIMCVRWHTLKEDIINFKKNKLI